MPTLGATDTVINTTTPNNQFIPAITALADGKYVVTWTSDGAHDGSGLGVYAQLFAANGAPIGGEVQVNTLATGDQTWPQVVALKGGGYLIAWKESVATGGPSHGQVFSGTGQKVGGELTLSSGDTGGVDALADGGF